MQLRVDFRFFHAASRGLAVEPKNAGGVYFA